MRFLFFLFGIPMMIISFFEVSDVVPLAEKADLLVDGQIVELSQEQQVDLVAEVSSLFENSRTVPAYGVIFNDEFHSALQSGTFVSLKFGTPFQINGLPFDELVFQVDETSQGVNIYRGNHGVFQGRCLCVNLQEDMSQLYEFVSALDYEIPEQDEEIFQSPGQDMESEQELLSQENEEQSNEEESEDLTESFENSNVA